MLVWIAYAAALIVVAVWRAVRLSVDPALPPRVRQAVRIPLFDAALFALVFTVIKALISPSAQGVTIWIGLACGAAIGLLWRYSFPALPALSA